MLSDGIASLLAGQGAITALVGTEQSRSDETTGIFFVQMPESSPVPAIVFSEIDGSPVADSHDGADPLHEARVGFTCHAKTGRQAKLLQVTLRRFLEGYQGLLADGTQVASVTLASESDAFSYAPFLFQAPIDFRILYRDTGSLSS
jgi:hypothetical protein